MATIEIYPSVLPGEPIEVHEANGGTFADWLAVNCPSFKGGDNQPVSVFVNGIMVAPSHWSDLVLEGSTRLEVRPNPRDPVTIALVLVATVVVGVVLARQAAKRAYNSNSRTGNQGAQLSGAELKANSPRLNQPIPEIAGTFRVFPDYLCQPRRYFVSPTKQAIDVMMCVGVGEYVIPVDQVRIGETPLTDLTEVATFDIFEPGASVSGNQASRNWYNAPEVGGSNSSSGLRLISGVSGTPQATATDFRITGNSIVIPQGAGVAPIDWEVGNILSIQALTRPISVIGGAGTDKDIVRGSFGDLSLAVNDQILIVGAGGNDGRYRVTTIATTTNISGTPSTIVGSAVASLSYSSGNITFSINGFSITLAQNFATATDLINFINSRSGGVVASQSGGIVTFTDVAPFSGLAILLSGSFSQLLGSTPTITAGTATQFLNDLTLDKWVEDSSAWFPANALQLGSFNLTEVQKARVKTVTTSSGTVVTYGPTEYRIASVIVGATPAGDGSIGWKFQRLNSDGSDDLSWNGFCVETNTPSVSIELDSSTITGGWLGPFNATPQNEFASIIEIDIFCPSGVGFINNSTGTISSRTKYFEAQWRSGSGAWTAVQYSLTGRSRDQLGFTYQIALPSSLSDIEVRIRRVGAEDTRLEALDRIEWYGLKTLLTAPTSYAGVTTMALTLQGSDKIASRSENQINLLVTRRLNGQNTRSIAEWVRYVCSTVGYSPQDIDEDELQALEAVWNTRQDFFDMPFIGQTTVKEVLQTALRVGFAELTIEAGKIRPVRDQARTTFEHLYTPQNMTSPLRRYFTSYDPDDFDGVDVEYTDSNTWEQEIVQCRLPGDVGLKVEKIRIDGVTNRTKAWRLGMRQRRIQQFRRKTFNFSTEWDALNSRYLSYCALSDDVPGYGQSAIVESFSGGVIQSSEPLKFQDGLNHVVALRRPDGTLAGPFPCSRVGEYAVSISEPLGFTPITRGAIEPTHLLFGSVETWSYPVLVTEIAPSGADKVDVQAVIYDNRVYLDDDNSPS